MQQDDLGLKREWSIFAVNGCTLRVPLHTDIFHPQRSLQMWNVIRKNLELIKWCHIIESLCRIPEVNRVHSTRTS